MAVGAETVGLEALTRAALDTTPRPLFGTKAKPGIFSSSGKAQKDAAVFLETKGFIVKTELVEAKKPLYRISPQGESYAIENAEPVKLLREIKDGIVRLLAMREQIEAAARGIDRQQSVLDSLLQRAMARPVAPVQSPTTPTVERPSEWLDAAIDFVRSFEREHPNQLCPLPNLYEHVVKPKGVSLGLFHDGVRRLADEGKLRLHPYTRPLYTIEREECALVAGQEIKYYAQSVNSSAAS